MRNRTLLMRLLTIDDVMGRDVRRGRLTTYLVP